jgi:predicted RNase H-like HicB family nuclease
MLRYAMLIQWSDEDKTYLITFPEWPNPTGEPHAHGDT